MFKTIGQAIEKVIKGDFDGAKAVLRNGFTFSTSARVTQLQQERDANRQTFKNESLARAQEIANAWRAVELTKKDASALTEDEQKAIYDSVQEPPFEYSVPTTTSEGVGTAETVAGSAKQIRNITVNIDAFNKGGINTTNMEGLRGMDAQQIEEWFNQMLLRTIRNLEMSY